MDEIKIKIDGQEISARAGQTVLQAAQENGIDIPSLCFHADLETKNHCNLCLVQIQGEENLRRACGTPVHEGMEILTESPEIQSERQKNLDKILDKHLMECDDCVWLGNCRLLELVKRFKAKPILEKKESDQVLQVGTVVFDQTKCIGCANCTAVCPTKFLDLNEHDKVCPSTDDTKDCINCGQCIVHCPVGAIEGIGEFEELEKLFQDSEKTVVVQFAPSIRTSIGEEFGLEHGSIATGKLITALKKVGFNFVFDTAAGADFTTMEESEEIIEKMTTGEKLPAMSSCCPAWVKFLEFYYPEFVPNLCTSRSPQIMLGGIVKKYWSAKNNLKPENIFMVSIMPCVAKKFEIKREELKIDDQYPVDMVLTTRELARLFRKKKIDLKEIEEAQPDNPLGDSSGAGVIYGASGGVFESALRTAYFKLKNEDLPDEAAKEIRGSANIKEKHFQIDDKTLKVCVVNGLKNAREVLERVKENPGLYDAIEVMACPGGCVGGGGQPVPTSREIIAKRAAGLYNIDEKKEIRRAHENMAVKQVYQEFFSKIENRRNILHTHFHPRKKSIIQTLKNSKENYDCQQ